MGSLWHPFSDMGAVESGGEFVIERGEGVHVYDTQGRRYLDATAGLWFTNVGHGRAELAEAAAEQMRTIAAYSTFGDYATVPTLELADRLEAIAPVPGSKIFLTSGGSDSVDTAAKMARRYWVEQGRPEKTVLLSRSKAYHGMHYAGTALAGIPGNREGYGELVPDSTAQVEWDSAEELRSTIERIGADKIAAFFCEPVIGAGGVYPPPEGYLTEVRKVCTEHDILFVADEVVTGYGRIGGSWFASSRFGLEPDLVTTAKGLTSGYAPMGAVLVAPRVWEPFFRTGAGVWFRHGYTYSGHAMASAVALANLDLLEREGLVEEAARLEQTLDERIGALADHERVVEVRSGVGAVAAIQLENPPAAMQFAARVRDFGIATRACGAGAIQISPSFTMTDDEVGELADTFREALDAPVEAGS
ncbi:aspartate aminotransferase family protein [Ornithinimicrobium sp. Y1847]|uniref:aminotransferase family protein n=1 Tax=Ornithinimicrobium sp. Y1847 TaxID=3405419 RepID=UPI003B66D2F9